MTVRVPPRRRLGKVDATAPNLNPLFWLQRCVAAADGNGEDVPRGDGLPRIIFSKPLFAGTWHGGT